MSFSKLPRLAILPVIVSASVLGFTHSASATTAATVNCKSTAGVNSIVYKVNDKVVAGLRGHVGQGSTVSIDFKINSGCTSVPVNISAYQAPSAIWDPKVADQQVLVGSVAGTFKPDGKVQTLKLVAPNCYYQVDFGTGIPMTHITGTNNQSSNGNLISADNGGTKACVTTTTTIPKTTTTLPKTTTTVAHTTTTVPHTTTTVPHTTTTVAQTTTTVKATTTTIATTATTVPQTTTTVANEVLSESIVAAGDPVVLGKTTLATTGSNTSNLTIYGALLVLIGSAFAGLANGIKRRRI